MGETTEMVASQPTSLVLPEDTELRQAIKAIEHFQAIIRRELRGGLDYGVIPGTQKPTLLKPGAEKVVKLLGLADEYDILDRQEAWDRGFFRYLVRCRLISLRSGVTVSQGLGECNSMEAKYRWRWVWPSEVPGHLDKSQLAQQVVKTSHGPVKKYRIENEDIYSQVNTILKMAKKRALVDAALSAGRLSDIFTQDLEDIISEAAEEPQAANEQPPAQGHERRDRPRVPSTETKEPQADTQIEEPGVFDEDQQSVEGTQAPSLHPASKEEGDFYALTTAGQCQLIYDLRDELGMTKELPALMKSWHGKGQISARTIQGVTAEERWRILRWLKLKQAERVQEPMPPDEIDRATQEAQQGRLEV
jgi:hypothetical protein